MASFTKRENGKWQAKIRRKGQRTISKTFNSKALAQRWARDVENKIDRGFLETTCEAEAHYFSDLFHKYWQEVVQFQKSANITIYTMNRMIVTFSHCRLIDMTSELIKQYKSERMHSVKGDTIRKDLLLLKRFFDYCMREWQIFLPKGNPLNFVTLPTKGRARDRRLHRGEQERLISVAENYGGLLPDIIILAIETGMRRGEIVKLKWELLDSESRVITIRDTKNGEDRHVPLSTKAAYILEAQERKTEFIFNIRGDSIGQAFRRITKRAGLEDLRFHDLRHEATSRFFERGFGIMEVSAITGHKDLGMLKRYTHLRADDLARKLG